MSEANGTDRKVLYLGMPCHAQPELGAARGLFRATRGGPKAPIEVQVTYVQASLLNANCNALLAWALSAKKAGRRVDYFGILHADVCPPDHWAEVLVEELEAKGLDLLSVAVPIKDPRGLVSTAIGHPGAQDYYKAHCRLTMGELYRLPPTFTAEDLGCPDRPLLVNTGLFVARMGPWAERVVFQDLNRIIETADGYRVETFPEDWHFARQCWQLGLKIGCTRKVVVDHRGPQAFSSAGPWGRFPDFDREYLAEPFVRTPPPEDGFTFPHEVGGWLSEAEGRFLRGLAEGRRVLEVGAYQGRSTICLASLARSVDTVDPFDGRATPDPMPCREEFRQNLRRHGLGDKVTAHVGLFADVAGHLDPGFDVVFIDADHSYPAVTSDVEHALDLVAPGGLLVFHDFVGRGAEPGVHRAVEDLVGQGGDLLPVVDSLAIVRPPARRPARVPDGPPAGLALSGS